MSIFLAFAATFPDIQIYLMFLLPIKIKYLGVIYAVMLLWQFLKSGVEGRIVIAASLLNVRVEMLHTVLVIAVAF